MDLRRKILSLKFLSYHEKLSIPLFLKSEAVSHHCRPHFFFLLVECCSFLFTKAIGGAFSKIGRKLAFHFPFPQEKLTSLGISDSDPDPYGSALDCALDPDPLSECGSETLHGVMK
jgi:hypothetical protein